MTRGADWRADTGRAWASHHEATDRQLAEVSVALLDMLDARPGERIVDLGCGAGATTRALAEAVGPTGRVTAVDIAPDLVAVARRRTADLPQVAVHEADAAAHPFAPAAHDALFSRHGGMFFDDPVAAFANLRRGLRPGARVAMSAFGPLAQNPWATVPAAAVARALGPAAPAPADGPGPFAWAEPETFRAVLAAAGFREIAWDGRDVSFALGAGDDPDPVARACAMALRIGVVARRLSAEDAPARARAVAALSEAFAPHVRDGWVRLPARIWLVAAVA